jgi:hypothetical protein
LLWYDTDFRASGNNSVVECDLAKVEVAGSNPVSRSILEIRSALRRSLIADPTLRILDRLLSVWYDAVFDVPQETRPIGAVAKW